MKIFIQLYKEITLAVDLGSEFVLESLNHPNIVVSQLNLCTCTIHVHHLLASNKALSLANVYKFCEGAQGKHDSRLTICYASVALPLYNNRSVCNWISLHRGLWTV